MKTIRSIMEGLNKMFGWEDYKVDAATRLMSEVAKAMQDDLETHGYDVTRIRQERGSVWIKFKPGPKTVDLEVEGGALPGELVAQLNTEGALVCSLNNARGYKGIPTKHLGNETTGEIASNVLFAFAEQLGTNY